MGDIGAVCYSSTMRRSPFVLAAVLLALTVALVLLLDHLYPGTLTRPGARMSLVWTLAWLATIGASLMLMLRHLPVSQTVRAALIWLAIGAALVALYLYLGDAAPAG